MRIRFGITAAMALVLGSAAGTQAQTTYGGTPYPYRYKDEPLMSINRSYLGYSNFVDYGPVPAHANPPPRGGYVTPYAAPRAPVYTAPRAPVDTTAPASGYSVPVRRGLFGWLRGYR